MMPPREFKVERLSDEFGQYELHLKCENCAHERRVFPKTLAHLCGWDAKVNDVASRLRCSKCGQRRCTARAIPPQKPRGLRPSH